VTFKPKISIKQHKQTDAKISQSKNNALAVAPVDLTKKQKRRLKDKNRKRILDCATKGGVCVEIGVWRGRFSRQILDTINPLHLALIDPWQHFEDTDKTDAFSGRTEEQRFEDIYQNVCEQYSGEVESGQVSIMRELSGTAIVQFKDQTIDFAYIDGDHSYEGVCADLAALFPKMKDDGIIAFDDYHRFGWWGDGVLRAIHEFVGQNPTRCRILMVEGAQIALSKLGPLPEPQAN
jgi:hypothetical protein